LNIYFDLEFTGLHKDTTLLSLGLVTDHQEEFYAEFNDYDYASVRDNKWLEENVFEKLVHRNGYKKEFTPNYHFGNRSCIRAMIDNWLNQFGNQPIQFVSDVSHYDFVLLIDLLWQSAMKMAGNVSCSCHDLNQDIARHYKISDAEAFDRSREAIVLELGLDPIEGDKHNALYDAKVTKAIYKSIYWSSIHK
jgi:hypothetical protein